MISIVFIYFYFFCGSVGVVIQIIPPPSVAQASRLDYLLPQHRELPAESHDSLDELRSSVESCNLFRLFIRNFLFDWFLASLFPRKLFTPVGRKSLFVS